MQTGQVIAAKYRLTRRLGVGGMGEVWAAVHVGTEREFAIKFMHAHSATSESSRQRFQREARASARINHPSIIDVFDVGEIDDGSLFLVMELLDGFPLADMFYAVPPLSVRDFLALMLDTAKALAAAHAAGIVHRDVKPGNIFLHKDRSSGLAYAKILDFGISKFSQAEDAMQTKTSSILGSPRYMSPEQTRSAASTDHRADLWAMGVVLFEGLTGRWPHDGDSFSSLVIAIATQPPHSIDALAPHLPEELRALVRACLLPIEQRIRSADEIAARLDRIIADGDLAAIPLPRPQGASDGSKMQVTTGNLRVRTPPPLTGSGSARPAHDLSRSGSDFSRSGTDLSRSGNDFSRSGADFSRSGSAVPPPVSSSPGFPSAHTAPMPPGYARPTGSFPGPPPAPSSQPSMPQHGLSAATIALPASAGGAPMPPRGFPPGSGVALQPFTITGGGQQLPGDPGRSARPDGLSASVSTMNVETVAYDGGDLVASRPEMPIPPAPPLAMAAPPLKPPSNKLGILVVVLSVAVVGIGIGVVAAARDAANASAPPIAPTVVVAPAAPTPAPSETAAADTAPSAQPATSAEPAASGTAPAPSASASAAAKTAARAPKTPPAAKPPSGKAPNLKDLGSGL